MLGHEASAKRAWHGHAKTETLISVPLVGTVCSLLEWKHRLKFVNREINKGAINAQMVHVMQVLVL